MKKLKTFLIWLIYGYDNRPIRTYLEYNRNNLFILGVDENYGSPKLTLLISQGFIPNETFNVIDHNGHIFFKPSIDSEIFYKLFIMYPFFGGFIFDDRLGLFWAVSFCIIINLCTWFNQLKNRKILEIKILEINDSLKILEYFKILRLKLVLERLSNFKNRTLSDYENHLQQQDVSFLRQIINDKDFLASRYSKFIIDLEFFINEFNLESVKYDEIMKCIKDHLHYNFDIRSRSLNLIEKKLAESLLSDISFFEDSRIQKFRSTTVEGL